MYVNVSCWLNGNVFKDFIKIFFKLYLFLLKLFCSYTPKSTLEVS